MKENAFFLFGLDFLKSGDIFEVSNCLQPSAQVTIITDRHHWKKVAIHGR